MGGVEGGEGSLEALGDNVYRWIKALFDVRQLVATLSSNFETYHFTT